MTPYNEEVCGTCKHCKRDFSRPQAEFCCFNEESEHHGIMTAFDDSCDVWEEKE